MRGNSPYCHDEDADGDDDGDDDGDGGEPRGGGSGGSGGSGGDDDGEEFWKHWAPQPEQSASTMSTFPAEKQVAGKRDAKKRIGPRWLPTARLRSKDPTPAPGEDAASKGRGRSVMSAEEAQRQAAEEGLHLVRSHLAQSGYRGVHHHGPQCTMAFKAGWTTKGSDVYLGSFPSTHEAALAVARYLGPAISAEKAAESAAAKTAAESEAARPEMSLEEARRQLTVLV